MVIMSKSEKNIIIPSNPHLHNLYAIIVDDFMGKIFITIFLLSFKILIANLLSQEIYPNKKEMAIKNVAIMLGFTFNSFITKKTESNVDKTPIINNHTMSLNLFLFRICLRLDFTSKIKTCNNVHLQFNNPLAIVNFTVINDGNQAITVYTFKLKELFKYYTNINLPCGKMTFSFVKMPCYSSSSSFNPQTLK